MSYYDTLLSGYLSKGQGGGTVDTEMSDTSTNPVQNKVIKKVDGKFEPQFEPLSIAITFNNDTSEYSANKRYEAFRQEWVDAIINSGLYGDSGEILTSDISKLNYPCTVTFIETEGGEPYETGTFDGAIIESSSQNSNDGRALFIAIGFHSRALQDNNSGSYYMCIFAEGYLFYQQQADDVIEYGA